MLVKCFVIWYLSLYGIHYLVEGYLDSWAILKNFILKKLQR